jgi:tRNA-Thr(GGU) m(6)t(6)A37 methyltransferase TsaA
VPQAGSERKGWVEELVLRPIGVVHSGQGAEESQDPEGLARIELLPEYAEGLDGVEEFSHLVVIYHLHRSRWSGVLKVYPRGNPQLPLTGVFATRSPVRPNPIAITAVRLVRREGNVLFVQGLDALDGSPVLDIKPLVPRHDLVQDVRVPAWAGEQ